MYAGGYGSYCCTFFFLTQKWSVGFAQNVFLMFSKVSFNWILLNEFIHGKNDVILANGHKLEKVSLKRFFPRTEKDPFTTETIQ